MIKKNLHLIKPLVTTGNSSIIKISDTIVSKVFYNKFNYLNELNILGKLRHPNIISIQDNYTDEYQKGVIEFTYYTDGDLLSFINRNVRTKKKHFTTNKKITMFKHILKPLIYMHNNNIIHGDIKPDNIVLHNQTPIMIDFSLSIYNTQFNDDLQDNTVIYNGRQGSDGYMAPEVKTNLIGTCSDVFSLGVVLYNLFTNEMPHYDKDTIDIPFTKITTHTIPYTIDNILHDMLQLDYTKRPSLEDIYNEL
jgi:serine/threonine protein kinase